MASETFTFAVDLLIHDFTCSPDELSQALGVQPSFALVRGQQLGSVTQKRSVWAGYLHNGSTDEEFAAALDGLLTLLEQRGDFLQTLAKQDAQVTCVIRGGVAEDDGIVFQLNLDSAFVRRCGLLNVGLRIEGWTPLNRFLERAKL